MIASLTLLLWFLLVLYLHKYYQKLKFVKGRSEIPTPPQCYPIIGHAHLFFGKPEKILAFINSLNKKFDRIVAFWLGPYYNVLVYDPKDVEVILKASKDTKKSEQYEFLRPWLGDSILLSDGAKFRRNKKIVVQSFNVNNLKKYLGTMNGQAKIMVEGLQKQVDKGEFDVQNYLRLGTIRTLLETTLGIDKETFSTADAMDYARAVEKVGRLVHMRTYKVWLYPEIIFRFSRLKTEQDKHIKILNELTDRVISKRKMEYCAKRKVDGGFLIDTFLESTKENGESFTDEEIKDEVMTMMFAGQDTTTVSIGFTLSLLGIYRDIQDRVVDELSLIFGDSNRPATYEDIQSMKYLEQVIQESWRLYPPIPLIARTLLNDVHLDNWILPKNCTVVIILMMLHRNPKMFPHPKRFDPDNFLPERIKARHHYSFLPFSSNNRACIGPKYAMMVIKVFVSAILRSYKIHSDKTTRDFVLAAETSLKRKEGYLVSLEHRKTLFGNN